MSVEILIQADLKHLEQIYLGNFRSKAAENNIGDEGMEILSRGKWDHLSLLVLCTFLVSLDHTNTSD